MSKFMNKSLSTHGAGVVCVHQKKIVLVQMNYGKYQGDWILPGGMAQPNEHPHEAAMREFKEETGLDIKLQKLLTVRHRLQSPINNTYWVYTGKLTCSEINPQLNWDSEELLNVQFFSPKEILQNPSVRPHTKYYISLYLNHIQVDSIKKMDGDFQDYCYNLALTSE